ncbi:MAG: hypothetical protein ACREBW_03100, partial [Candidatus Micrarchaeaceae archaeon]
MPDWQLQEANRIWSRKQLKQEDRSSLREVLFMTLPLAVEFPVMCELVEFRQPAIFLSDGSRLAGGFPGRQFDPNSR